MIAEPKEVLEVCHQVGLAWSGSWLGYHSNIYVQGLRPKNPGEHFDAEFGGMGTFANRTAGSWAEYSYEAVKDEIFRRAGFSEPMDLQKPAKAAGEAFENARQDLIPSLDAVLSTKEDTVLRNLRDKAAELKDHFSREEFVDHFAPKGQFYDAGFAGLHPRGPSTTAYSGAMLGYGVFFMGSTDAGTCENYSAGGSLPSAGDLCSGEEKVRGRVEF